MADLQFQGSSLVNLSTPEASGNVGDKNSTFPDKIRGLTSEIDAGSKKIITGWSLNSCNHNDWSSNANYNVNRDGKLLVNGSVISMMYNGTRPRNIACKATITGTNKIYYLNNVNGSLYLSTSANSASGTYITTSTAPNKDCIVNIALWGSGGKGGGGAYWFLAGNWGGVGGAGGGKVFVTACILNNDYFKITIDSDSDYIGRTTESADTTYSSPAIHLYKSNGRQWCVCYGGESGTAHNPRWSTDNYKGGGIYSVQSYGHLPLIQRKYTDGANKNSNGKTGNSCSFYNYQSPHMGNPEGHQGSLVLTGAGGVGPDSGYTQSHGSGGAGSYGNGGNAGDTGNGSNGSAGSNGGGGGGAGSPAGGAAGGNGGLPGFKIFY